MPARHGAQYTVRGVPPEVDQKLRRIARDNHLSLNELLLRELTVAAGEPHAKKRRSFEGIAGTWVDDPEFDRILESQRQIDPDLWR